MHTHRITWYIVQVSVLAASGLVVLAAAGCGARTQATPPATAAQEAAVGYYKLTSYPPGGSVDKFTTVLKRDPNGRWRFQVDAYNGAPASAFEAAPTP